MMAKTKPFVGFLSPEAEFYECTSWGHLDKAAELCDELGIEYCNRLEAEEKLLEQGWVVFNARGAYYSYYKHIETPVITDKVINFLKNNIGNYNNNDQEERVKEILESITVFGRFREKAVMQTTQRGDE